MDQRSLPGGREHQSLRQRLWRYLPVILWLGFISVASTGEFSADETSRIIGPILLWLFPRISPERLALIHAIVRKTAHFFEYAVLAFLSARLFRSSSRRLLRRHWFGWSLLLVASYSLLDEYHQSFVPSRTSSLVDSLIDTLGGLTALVIVIFWARRHHTKR